LGLNHHSHTDQPSTPRKLGFYGGAFDPPHLAHLALAKQAIAQLNLDTLFVTPTGQAGHKAPSKTPALHRLAMLALAFADMTKVVIDDRETRRTGPSYTVDSLIELNAEHPQAQWFLIIGEDQARALEGWRQWQEIVEMAQVVVAARAPDAPASTQDGRWHNRATQNAIELAFPCMDISATGIREALQYGRPISQWVKPSVNDYIQHHHLYRQNR
jgi:nicotinate-nucleotide adenylyltransferase